MRIGLTTSVIGHVLLFVWGFASFSGAKPFDVTPIDALPVDLVPISDVSKIAEGTKTAPKSDNASQAKVKPPIPRPDSQRAGAAKNDQSAPITEKATDTAAAKTADAPPPPPKAAPPKPVETPPPPAEKPAEQKVATAEDAPKADTGEIAEKIKEAEKPVPTPPKPPPVKPKPPAPTPTEDTADQPDKTDAKPVKEKPKQTQKDSKSKDFDPNEMAALLNKVDPSGGGGKESDKEASLGSENRTGPVAEMSQSELDALTAAVTACFNPPVGAEGVDQMVVPLRVTFTIDGDLAAPPEIKAVPAGPAGQAVAEAAVRAVQRCAPYPFLPKDKFDNWQVVNMNFTPPSSY
ncbi:hypothetical protein [Pleomorphomonas oryzae]|uniref:hypothetical protein n=1 Tax=Pleomorphomonas oryzae TaxID=261934 RepID=UPI00041CC1F9|nr:hypothetical protein [Pleomorphomonas oryzae]